MSASYARLPDGGNDFGGSVVGRRRWSFADCARAHGRQIERGSMYTDQHTDRSGSKAENSMAFRAVLWDGQVLPQGGQGLRRRYSARRGEQSRPQPASSRECTAARSIEKQQSSSFDSRNRESGAQARQKPGRESASAAGSGKRDAHAQREQGGRNGSSSSWSRNRQSQQTGVFAVSRIQCCSSSNQETSKRKASWYGKETYATQMARTGALAQ
jgi:hypothetical protein